MSPIEEDSEHAEENTESEDTNESSEGAENADEDRDASQVRLAAAPSLADLQDAIDTAKETVPDAEDTLADVEEKVDEASENVPDETPAPDPLTDMVMEKLDEITPEDSVASPISVVNPQDGATPAPGDTLQVRWTAPANDPVLFLTAQSTLYVVSLTNEAGDEIARATAYECEAVDIGQFECFTSIALPEDASGDVDVSVQLNPTHNADAAQQDLCDGVVNGIVQVCDAVTVIVDTSPPTATPCVAAADGCRDELVATEFPLAVDASDADSDIASRTAWVSNDGLQTEKLDVTDGAKTVDVSGLVSEDPAGETVTLNAQATDEVDRTTHTTETITFEATPPTITEVCPRDGSSCLAADSDDEVDIETTTVNVEASATDAGSGVDSIEVWAERSGEETEHVTVEETTVQLDLKPILDEVADGEFRGDGITFHTQATDAFGTSATDATAGFEVDTAADPTIALSLENNPKNAVPNGQTVELTYEADWIGGDRAGEDADGETVKLTDANDPTFERTATTDLSGLVTFSLSDENVSRTLEATIVDQSQDAKIVDPSTVDVTWADVQIERVASEDEPGGEGNFATAPGETYKPAYKVTLSHDGSAVDGARVTLTDEAGDTFSAITGEDGLAKVPVSRKDPSTVTFTSKATYDPSDGPTQGVTGEDVTVHWAKVQFADLQATHGDNTQGWHAVGDTSTLSFTAEVVDGTGPVAADGATVEITAGDTTKRVVTNETGFASADFTFDQVTDVTPKLTLVSTPEGIEAFDENDFGRERWTEIDLTASLDDDFVNTGDTVTATLEAHWAHDQDGDETTADPVAGTSVDVVNASESTETSCPAFDGTGTCSITLERVYDDGFTLNVTSTDKGLTRQLDATDTTIDPIWTEIVVRNADDGDDFVNRDDTVTLDAEAVWAHTTEADDDSATAVPEATIVGDDGLPASCSLGDDAQVTDGDLTVDASCSEVTDGTIPLTVDTASEDVTKLSESLSFNATWTALEVTFSMEDENGNTLAPGSLLDHNAPVRFTGNVSFAHDTETGTPAPSDTRFIFEVSDGETFNCLTSSSEDSCVTDVSKESGEFTFDVSASSQTDGNDDGFVEADITDVKTVELDQGDTVEERSEVTFRWTSIGFAEFECNGKATDDDGDSATDSSSDFGSCDTTYFTDDTRSEIVEVRVTAIAEDTRDDENPQTLGSSKIQIAGQEDTTGEDGTATRDFVRTSPGETTVTARGLSADFDGDGTDDVTWDTPRSETITWSDE